MNRLEGKAALITGGGTGLGLGMAYLFAKEGAVVTIAGRRENVLLEAAEKLRSDVPGAEIRTITCDITVEDQVAKAVEKALVNGALDIMVANAGSTVPGPIMQLDMEDWRTTCDLNIGGSAMCIKHGALAMKNKGGSIITITSTAGQKVEKWIAPYSVTKAGLEHLTRCAAVELSAFKIRVNSIYPGWITTESNQMLGDVIDSALRNTPLGYFILSEEFANLALFLASDESRYMTGQIIGMDGGLAIPIGEDFETIARLMYGDALMDEYTGKKK